MSETLKDLIYKIGGDTSGFDKAMRHLNGQASDTGRNIERQFERAGRSIASMGINMARNFLGPLSVAGAVAGLQRVASSVAEIGNEAKRAGLSARVFQEWKFVAERARVPVDAMVDAFKELNIRADEFVATGKGSAAEAFARLGLTREEVQEKLRDPSALMLELIERTRQLRNTAAGARIFDELFGGAGGERFLSLLHQGEGAIRSQIKAAHDLGHVIDDELIKRAEEIDRKFNQLATTISTRVKSAVLEVAGTMSAFVDSFNEVDQRQTDTINRQIEAFEKRIRAEKAQMGGILSVATDRFRQANIDGMQRQVDELRAALRDRTLNQMRPMLQSNRDGGLAAKGDRLGYVPPDDSDARDRSSAATSRQRDAVKDLISELEHELDLLSRSELEKAKLNALRRAGADATDIQRQRIEGLVEAIHRETEASKAAEEAQKAHAQSLENLFQMGSDAIGSIIDRSVKAEDSVKKLAVQLALAAAQAALLGSGPLAGLFGGLFGGGSFVPNTTASAFFGAFGKPGFSQGTANTGGQRGEPRGIVHGQEAVIPLPDGGKVPVEMIMPRMPDIAPLRAGRTEMTFNMSVVVSGNGDRELMERMQKATELQMAEALGAFDREVLPVRVNQIAADPYARG